MDGSLGVTNRPAPGRSGESWWTDGVDGRLSVRAVYAIVIGLIAAWTVVTIFSTARDISWRLGSPHNLWEPVLWNVTSAIVGVAVLPLVRRGALLFRDRPVRLLTAAAAFVALALAYSALHIAGMGVFRELAYALGGWDYTFPWSRQIPYELRKDLFNYLAIAVIFWFAERPARAAPVQVEQDAPKVDGRARGEAGAVAARRPHQRADRCQRDRLGQFGRQLRGI